jgi:PAS domain S-box-containing protein
MMVWIGFAENDDGKSVTPVASSGFEDGYLEHLDISWADTERGRGPTGTAIRTGKPSGCRNMLTDPAFKPWREEAMKRGYASSLVLPLLTGKKAFGAMTIYSKEPDSFTADETALLTDLSDDLAYGILTIRLQKARALAEETVRKERNFSNAVIQTTSGLIIGMDPEGRIQLFNHACEKITGYTFNELKGKPFWDYLLLPEEMDAVKEVFKGIKDGKITAESEFENYWKTKGGSRRFIRWANSALKDASGNVELIIGTGIDMTDDKENRARIDELNSFLMQKTTDLLYANKELETFSYSVSHDLRSPLRAIKGFSTILLKDYSNNLDADGQDFLNRIKGGADRMSDLIDDMLSLAKISRDEMDPKEIDLSDVVESIVSELRQAEKDRNVEAIITKGLKAHCDARLMHIALSNLIGNAWKYSSRTPYAVIEFGTVEKNEETVFFVRDNGAGFDMAHAKKLFTPFQRLHSDSHFTGTGIGLAIVNKVIQRHGGRIWGEGKTGKGATFYFTLKDVNS